MASPLVRLARFSPARPVFAKLEHLVLTGGVFDRVARAQVALSRGDLERAGTAVIAGTGSTCLAFAAALADVRTKIVAVCPKNLLAEHRILLRMHRLELELSDPDQGLHGAHALAVEEATRRGGVLLYSPEQEGGAAQLFAETVGAELAESTADIGAHPSLTVVVPFASAALVSGVARALAAGGVRARVLATVSESRSSRQDDLYTASQAPALEGVEPIMISDRDALDVRAELARTEGLLVGLSSAGALRIARAQTSGAAVAVVIDAGDRYFSIDREESREAAR